MLRIDKYLERFKNLKPGKKVIKEDVVKIISNIIGLDIKEYNIDIKNNTAYIKTEPIIKNQIFLKKQQILKQFLKEISTKNLRDIR